MCHREKEEDHATTYSCRFSSVVSVMIDRMKELGVKKCGATHCTGDMAIKMVREAYGQDVVEMGVGKQITLPVTYPSSDEH